MRRKVPPPPPTTDQFDRIPDAVVVVILNKLADVRALGRCSAVSRRFHALVSSVHDVHVKIDTVVTVVDDDDDERPPSLAFRPSLENNPIPTAVTDLPGSVQAISFSPRVLGMFTDVRNLTVELPAGDVRTDDGVVLKWSAEFGSTLQSCVVLGGTQSPAKSAAPAVPNQSSSGDHNHDIPDSFYTNGEFKVRVVWTISSLIAAATRHHLLRPTINAHPSLRKLVMTDADGQGTLTMGPEQLQEFREANTEKKGSEKRTQVPASNMKLRYAEYLDVGVPEGAIGLHGATLVVVKPSGDGGRREAEAAFEGPFDAVVKELVKRRTYLLEMNGF